MNEFKGSTSGVLQCVFSSRLSLPCSCTRQLVEVTRDSLYWTFSTAFFFFHGLGRLESPEARRVSSIVYAPSRAYFILRTKPWNHRNGVRNHQNISLAPSLINDKVVVKDGCLQNNEPLQLRALRSANGNTREPLKGSATFSF